MRGSRFMPEEGSVTSSSGDHERHKRVLGPTRSSTAVAVAAVGASNGIERATETRASDRHQACPRSHSIRTISNAKIKTVKLTVAVVVGYLICSAPFVFVQLYTVWAEPGECRNQREDAKNTRYSQPHTHLLLSEGGRCTFAKGSAPSSNQFGRGLGLGNFPAAASKPPFSLLLAAVLQPHCAPPPCSLRPLCTILSTIDPIYRVRSSPLSS